MMKYLKYLLVAIILLALIFFGRGLLTPAITYESEVVVKKPIGESWSIVTDESRISDWLKSIKKIELINGTANTVGAVSKIYVEEDGEEMVMEETITAFRPNEYIAMTFTMDFMNMNYEMTLKETEGKTKITTKSVTKGNGIFSKSILSFMSNSMKKQESENLNNLKILIEGNTVSYNSEIKSDSTEKSAHQ